MSDEPLIAPSLQKLLLAERNLLTVLTTIQRELAAFGVPSLKVEGRSLLELFEGQTEPDLSASADRNARRKSRGLH